MEPTKRLFNGAAELGVVDCKYDGHLHGFGRYEPDIGGQDILWSTPVREKADAERIALCVNAHERLVATNDALVAVCEAIDSVRTHAVTDGNGIWHAGDSIRGKAAELAAVRIHVGLLNQLRGALALARSEATTKGDK